MQIEGKNAVKEALLSGMTINKLMVDKSLSQKDEIIAIAYKNKVKIEFLPKAILDKKTTTAHHQGYIAQAVDFEYCDCEEILNHAKTLNKKPFIILLDGIEDPHNFGAIIRSCECAGVDGIVISKNRCAQVNDTVIKTSTGAIANMLIARVTNLKEAIDFFKENDVWVYAAEADGQNIYQSKFPDAGLAIVIGSEGNGVKKSIKTYCDGVVSLPLKGKVNSLNASVACGIIIFEILRQNEEKAVKKP